MILDVGCGSSPKGHVNIDLFVGETPHQNAKPINPKLIPNFIKASAEFLPFCDNSFDVVVSRHVLEHLDNPTKAILDMLRVAKKEVIFIVPHRYRRKGIIKYQQHEKHINFFGVKNTYEWLHKLRLSFEIEVIYRGIPNNFLNILKLPDELKVKVRERA